MINRCPQCGAENPLSSPSCSSCGRTRPSWDALIGKRPAASRTPPPIARGKAQVLLSVVRATGGTEARFAMQSDDLVIGSAGDISLPKDCSVEPQHVQISFDERSGELFAIPLVKDAGVYLRVRAKVTLKPVTEIRCGQQRLRLEARTLSRLTDDQARIWGSPAMESRFCLVQLLDGGAAANVFPLLRGENLLGRERGNISFPHDNFVSGNHAVLHADDEAVELRDLGSANGTFVLLTKRTLLKSSDQLLIGHHLFKFEMR